MADFFQGLVMGFREGLEAFLIIAIMIRYLSQANKHEYKKHVWTGASLGVLLSVVIGFILFLVSRALGNLDSIAKLWESFASFLALLLVSTFIVWMIKNGSNMVKDIENKIDINLSKFGIITLSFVLIAREGTEIAIFTFAGNYSLISIFIGILASLILVILIFYSLVKVNLRTIFNITLAYLILQAGFLLGYSIHEGMSAFKDLGYLASTNPIFTKLFDLSSTVLNHKTGIIGIPLYVSIGWYSKPEIIQFVVQYTYTGLMFTFWYLQIKKSRNHLKKE
ncbi:MAG: FTR1 family protein [Tenericutes bacterium]|nr:FTR1 family protein [Mycoplasmatota bacterium]